MSSATFPESPSFVKQYIPSPPLYIPEEQTDAEYLEKLSGFLSGQYVGLKTLQNSVASGWLIETLRVLDLDANTITAGTIFTQDLYIGNDGSGSIGLLGTETLIEVVDEAGTTRVQIGDFGASNDDWGVKVNNAAGSTIFQATSTTFINGAIITDGTITGAKIEGGTITGAKIDSSTITNSNINDVNGSKLVNGSVGNTKIDSLSASKITLSGTLTCTSSTTAIEVTSSGAMVFQSGGDIIMKASSSGDDTLIQLQTSLSSLKGEIGYNTSSDLTYIRTDNGADLYLISDGKIVINPNNASIDLGASSSDDITFVGRVVGDILPNSSGSGSIGNASNKFALVRATTITSGDLRFENDFILIEPNELDPDADPYSGLAVMNSDYEQIGFLDKDGNLQVAGAVEENVIFEKPKKKRKEYSEINKAAGQRLDA